MADRPAAPREIAANMKTYAFERSLGMPPAEACRRAGGKVENGLATKWEQNRRVQAWIAYYRSLGQDAEMIAAKRARIEERLELAAYGNIFDFATMIDRVVIRRISEEETEETTVKTPIIDWDKVAASPYSAIIAGFKFDKESGVLVDFERDSALAAAAQLRDMHGFKAASKSELSGINGAPIQIESPASTADRAHALAAFVAKTRAEKPA